MQLSSEEFLPPYFIRFLKLVTAGEEDVGSSLVLSIEQHLCRAVSEAEWKLPKHVLILVSVKHLCRSAQAGHDDMRGHSESFDFGLDLETVLTKAQVEVSTYLMPQIVTEDGNIGFHRE